MTNAIAQIKAHLQVPLYRNGYVLMFTTVATAILGVAYWVLAARSYSAEVVGVTSALLAALTLLSGAAQLSLNGALVRFLPVAGRQTPRLIGYTYALSVLAAAALGLVFGLTAGSWSPTLRFLSELPALPLFVGAAIAWTIFPLQDSVLTGLRQTPWIAVENITFAILKIGLLLVFAPMPHGAGLFASWAVPTLLSLVPVSLLIVRLIPRHITQTAAQASEISTRQIGRYAAGNFPGWLFFLASTTLLPIMVADQLGTSANAYFYLPWTIASSLNLVALNMMTSLTVESAADQSRLELYCYRALVQSLRLVVPIVAVVAVGAPYILLIFGRGYADEGAWLLRLLVCAVLPNTIVSLYIASARVRNHPWAIVVVQAVLCVITLGLSAILLPRLGIAGAGVAWLTAQTSVAAVVLVKDLLPMLRQGRLANRAAAGSA